MRRWTWPLVAAAVLASAGCGAEATPSVTRTVTATATVTTTTTPKTTVIRPERTVTVTATPSEPESGAESGPTSGGRIKLTVFSDGCGVIRSEPASGAYSNLTWTFRDADGFQVLGRNAEGETRYRYFRPGTYTVAVEAWVGEHYAPVSNTVTVHC